MRYTAMSMPLKRTVRACRNHARQRQVDPRRVRYVDLSTRCYAFRLPNGGRVITERNRSVTLCVARRARRGPLPGRSFAVVEVVTFDLSQLLIVGEDHCRIIRDEIDEPRRRPGIDRPR